MSKATKLGQSTLYQGLTGASHPHSTRALLIFACIFACFILAYFLAYFLAYVLTRSGFLAGFGLGA